MVDRLIPQSIRLKQKYDVPPRLIDDYEIAAAIGLAYQELGEELPEEESLELLRKKILEREDLNKSLRNLLESSLVNGKRTDWRRIMEVAYQYTE